jgi:hypothetical protein
MPSSYQLSAISDQLLRASGRGPFLPSRGGKGAVKPLAPSCELTADSFPPEDPYAY